MAPAGQTVVEAFYAALHEGNGEEAARFILPSKRRGGLSAAAMTRFYGTLGEPLTVASIRPLGLTDFEVFYRFEAARSACNGRSVISTVVEAGSNYISSIRSLSGC